MFTFTYTFYIIKVEDIPQGQPIVHMLSKPPSSDDQVSVPLLDFA